MTMKEFSHLIFIVAYSSITYFIATTALLFATIIRSFLEVLSLFLPTIHTELYNLSCLLNFKDIGIRLKCLSKTLFFSCHDKWLFINFFTFSNPNLFSFQILTFQSYDNLLYFRMVFIIKGKFSFLWI